MYVCKYLKFECLGDKGVLDIEFLIYELYGKIISFILKWLDYLLL